MSVPRIRIDFGSGLEEVPLPRNWQQIKFEAIFTDEFPSASLQSILFEWTGESARKINEYFALGMVGGTGIGEGIPLEICIGNPLIKFNVIIDLGNSATTFERDIVKAPIKRVGSSDWLSDMMRGVTFTLLNDIGMIGPPPGDPGHISGSKYFYKKVPYVVTIPTDIPQAITLVLEEAALVNAIINATNNTAKSIAIVLADFGITATVALAPVGVIQGIADFAGMLIDVTFDILLGIALIGNIEMLLGQFGLIKKYKYAMTANDLINATFDYINSLGVASPISFKSSILTDPQSHYHNLTIMPRKTVKQTSPSLLSSLIKGKLFRGNEIGEPNTYGYYDYDSKKMFEQLNQVFNAKGVMIGNIMQWEETHQFNNIQSGFALPNVGKPGFNFNWPQPGGTNWGELAWYYRIAFATDPMDERTSIDYTGTSCAITLQPKIVKNALNLIPPDKKEIVFPFALAKRKEHLNIVEVVVNDILNVVAPIYDTLASVYNDVVDTANSVSTAFGNSVTTQPLPLIPPNPLYGLIGCMETSGDQWQEQKLFIGMDVGGDWQIHPANGANNLGVYNNPNAGAGSSMIGEGFMSAYAIMQQFHGLNLATRGNQWHTYTGKRFAINSKIFNDILNNNIIFTADGKMGKFEKMLWVLNDDEAQEVSYRINQAYTNNLKESISIDGN